MIIRITVNSTAKEGFTINPIVLTPENYVFNDTQSEQEMKEFISEKFPDVSFNAYGPLLETWATCRALAEYIQGPRQRAAANINFSVRMEKIENEQETR